MINLGGYDFELGTRDNPKGPLDITKFTNRKQMTGGGFDKHHFQRGLRPFLTGIFNCNKALRYLGSNCASLKNFNRYISLGLPYRRNVYG